MSLLLPHQQRVVTEQRELTDRLCKLQVFLKSDLFATLPEDERSRLHRQSEVMDEYSQILAARIAAFTN